MKQIRIEDSVGCILSHDVTKIVPGEFKGRLFKKGHVIREEDIPKLLDIGKEHIYVWEPKKGQLHENDAAIRVKDLVLGQGCYISEEIKEGKIDFFASYDGVLKIDKDALLELNMIDDIMMATIHNNTPVKKGEKLGGTRVIPLMVEEEKLNEAKKLIEKPFISVEKFKKKKVGIVTTGNEVFYGRIKDAFGPVIKSKFEYYGSEILGQVILPDDKEKITEAIKMWIDKGADIVVCSGGMSVDPDDVTPSAIKDCGGEVVTYGSPVLPGAMFLLAYLGDTPIMGLPGCVMYSKRTVFDLVLPRILIDEKLTKRDIALYGQGGLCLDCKVCTFPHCSFGK